MPNKEFENNIKVKESASVANLSKQQFIEKVQELLDDQFTAIGLTVEQENKSQEQIEIEVRFSFGQRLYKLLFTRAGFDVWCEGVKNFNLAFKTYRQTRGFEGHDLVQCIESEIFNVKQFKQLVALDIALLQEFIVIVMA